MYKSNRFREPAHQRINDLRILPHVGASRRRRQALVWNGRLRHIQQQRETFVFKHLTITIGEIRGFDASTFQRLRENRGITDDENRYIVFGRFQTEMLEC